jgi:hypothetical protein
MNTKVVRELKPEEIADLVSELDESEALPITNLLTAPLDTPEHVFSMLVSLAITKYDFSCKAQNRLAAAHQILFDVPPEIMRGGETAFEETRCTKGCHQSANCEERTYMRRRYSSLSEPESVEDEIAKLEQLANAAVNRKEQA